MIFSSDLLKIWSFRRVPRRAHDLCCIIWKDVFFFSENMTFLPWAESETRPFPGNTGTHDASPAKKK